MEKITKEEKAMFHIVPVEYQEEINGKMNYLEWFRGKIIAYKKNTSHVLKFEPRGNWIIEEDWPPSLNSLHRKTLTKTVKHENKKALVWSNSLSFNSLYWFYLGWFERTPHRKRVLQIKTERCDLIFTNFSIFVLSLINNYSSSPNGL